MEFVATRLLPGVDDTCCAQAAEAAVRAGVQSGGGAALPGMIFNQSKKVTYTDAVSGRERSVYAGRMECTMQACCWLSQLALALRSLSTAPSCSPNLHD